MPGFGIEWLFYSCFVFVMAGNMGVAFCYWWNIEYKLAGIYLCYAVASAIFMTIVGVK